MKDLSISEIAYGTGFKHPWSFCKLFKTKTNFSAVEFKQLVNGYLKHAHFCLMMNHNNGIPISFKTNTSMGFQGDN